MNNPLVTTLIPTFQRPQLLARALRSILVQQSVPICVQVLDNCSTDDTPEVIAAFQQQDDRVRYYRHTDNIGAVANFVSALDFVTTPYFSFLSDDDILMPHFYEKACECFSREPEAMFVVFNCLFSDEDLQVTSILSKKLKPGLHFPPEGFWELFRYGPRTWTAIVFRSSILENDRPETLFGGCFDLDFIFRLAAKYSYYTIDHIGAVYVSRADSYSGMFSNVVNCTDSRLMLYNRISSLSHLPADITKKILSRLQKGFRRRLLKIGINQVLDRDRKNVLKTINALEKHENHYLASALRLLMDSSILSTPMIKLLEKTEKKTKMLCRANSKELQEWERNLKNYVSELLK